MSTEKSEMWIPKSSVDSILNKFNNLARRASKNGLDAPECHITDDVKEKRYNVQVSGDPKSRFSYTPSKLKIELVRVELKGEMPVFNGWKFMASIGHNLENEIPKNLVISSIFNSEEDRNTVKDMREDLQGCPPNCEHCDLPRNRKQTFLLEHNVSKEQKQVGSTCIDDFLGEKSLQKALWYFEMDAILRADHVKDYVENFYSTISTRATYPVPLDIYLAQASLISDSEGFVSRAQASEPAESTANKALHAFVEPNNVQQRLFDAYDNGTPHKQLDKAREIIDFYSSIDTKNKDFLFKIKTIVARGEVNLNNPYELGITGYMPEGYRKDLERSLEIEKDKNTPGNKPFGKEKERGVLKLKLQSLYERTDVDRPYTYFEFKDDNGTKFSWTTGSSKDLEIGKSYTMKATIKGHSSNKDGVHRTLLTRCANILEVSDDFPVPDFKEVKKLAKKKEIPEDSFSP
jgi:hypothetical protein